VVLFDSGLDYLGFLLIISMRIFTDWGFGGFVGLAMLVGLVCLGVSYIFVLSYNKYIYLIWLEGLRGFWRKWQALAVDCRPYNGKIEIRNCVN